MAVNNNNVRLMDMKAEILRQADLFMAADSSVVNTRESKDYQNFNHELLPDQFDTSSMEDRGLLSTEENLIMEFKAGQGLYYAKFYCRGEKRRFNGRLGKN